MEDFVHLHVHSQYSILDGQASISKMVDKAIADGMKGMALTDHGNMMGVKDFFNYTEKVISKAKKNLKELKGKLEQIQAEALSCLGRLKEITIPKYVDYIGDYAFAYCS
mgnify:CR=1 FL=1